jgi:hypothetical protein
VFARAYPVAEAGNKTEVFMKTKVLFGLAVIVIPVFLWVTAHKNTQNRPPDFRDAPADEQLQELLPAGQLGSQFELPVPQVPSRNEKLAEHKSGSAVFEAAQGEKEEATFDSLRAKFGSAAVPTAEELLAGKTWICRGKGVRDSAYRDFHLKEIRPLADGAKDFGYLKKIPTPEHAQELIGDPDPAAAVTLDGGTGVNADVLMTSLGAVAVHYEPCYKCDFESKSYYVVPIMLGGGFGGASVIRKLDVGSMIVEESFRKEGMKKGPDSVAAPVGYRAVAYLVCKQPEPKKPYVEKDPAAAKADFEKNIGRVQAALNSMGFAVKDREDTISFYRKFGLETPDKRTAESTLHGSFNKNTTFERGIGQGEVLRSECSGNVCAHYGFLNFNSLSDLLKQSNDLQKLQNWVDKMDAAYSEMQEKEPGSVRQGK